MKQKCNCPSSGCVDAERTWYKLQEDYHIFRATSLAVLSIDLSSEPSYSGASSL